MGEGGQVTPDYRSSVVYLTPTQGVLIVTYKQATKVLDTLLARKKPASIGYVMISYTAIWWVGYHTLNGWVEVDAMGQTSTPLKTGRCGEK